MAGCIASIIVIEQVALRCNGRHSSVIIVCSTYRHYLVGELLNGLGTSPPKFSVLFAYSRYVNIDVSNFVSWIATANCYSNTLNIIIINRPSIRLKINTGIDISGIEFIFHFSRHLV